MSICCLLSNNAVTSKNPTPSPPDYVSVGGPVAAVIVVLLSATVFITVVLALLMKRTVTRRQRRTLQHRPSKHLLLKSHFTKEDTYIDLCSLGAMKAGELEFPRQRLELQMTIGIVLVNIRTVAAGHFLVCT